MTLKHARKAAKRLVEQVVEVKWRDPLEASRDATIDQIPHGRQALAYQRDWGILERVQDDVLTIISNAARTTKDGADDTFRLTYIPLELVTAIVVYDPGQTYTFRKD